MFFRPAEQVPSRAQPGPTAATQEKGKGKARAVDANVATAPAEDNFFESWLGALDAGLSDEEQDVILRQLGILGPDSPRPALAREGVAGPSGTRSRPAQHQQQSASKANQAQHVSVPSSPASVHSQSFASIEAVESQFTALKTNFEFPANVEFEHGSSELAFTPVNAPVKQYENDLAKLLTKLDSIDSDGTESIRGARKALVHVVEAELDRVEGLKAEAWQKKSETVVATVEEPTQSAEETVQGYDVAFPPEVSSASSSASPENTVIGKQAQAVVPNPHASPASAEAPSDEAGPAPIADNATAASLQDTTEAIHDAPRANDTVNINNSDGSDSLLPSSQLAANAIPAVALAHETTEVADGKVKDDALSTEDVSEETVSLDSEHGSTGNGSEYELL